MSAAARTSGARERRYTRKAFLTGAATIGGAALLVGLGLAGRDAASGLLDGSAGPAPGDEASWHDQAQSDDAGCDASSQDPGGAGGGSGGTTGSGTATARVAVDSGRRVGCGACLQVCPAAVFAASGSVVAAQDPEARRLCARCTQVCQPGAITLSA